MITNIYYADRAGEEIVKMVRDKDPETGVERLMSPTELKDPQNIEVGDHAEDAYKVSIFSKKGDE